MRCFKIILNILLLGFLLASCSNRLQTEEFELNLKWTFRQADTGKWFPANVPGNVHTDLLANNLISDSILKNNPAAYSWIEQKAWEYKAFCSIPAEIADKDHIEITFNGLDTYADVYLNDSLVLQADNMFRIWRISCKSLLKSNGNNTIYVKFWPPAQGLKLHRPDIAVDSLKMQRYVRKASYHFGTSWSPRILTSGIWKSVSIKGWNELLIDDVVVGNLKLSPEKAQYTASLDVFSEVKRDYTLRIQVDGHELDSVYYFNMEPGLNHLKADFAIDKPELWWTAELGSPRLYTIYFRFYEQGRLVTSNSYRLGVRNIELLQERDSLGRSFCFSLNGRKLFIKGLWCVPPDFFVSRVSPEKYQELINTAKELHVNMLRVPGSSIFNNEAFYNLCDENGIMVWQDFMFDLTNVPTDSVMLPSVEAEVTGCIKLLRPHACLAVWCGMNNMGGETILGKRIQQARVPGRIIQQIIPGLIKRYDPQRIYCPYSPGTIGKSSDLYDDYSAANIKKYRFVAAHGTISLPDTASGFFLPCSGNITGNQNKYDCWTTCPLELLLKQIESRYWQPLSFKHFAIMSQLNQQALGSEAVETHRLSMPRCMGTFYNQLNDCWPGVTTSAIDFAGNPKAMFYSLKQDYAPVSLVLRSEQGNIRIYVVSDNPASLTMKLSIECVSFSGEAELIKSIPVLVQTGSRLLFSIPEEKIVKNKQANNSVIKVSLEKEGQLVWEGLHYFVALRELNLQKPVFDVKTEKEHNFYHITVCSNTLAKSVILTCKTGQGRFSNNYFDVIPGMPVQVDFSTNSENPVFDITSLYDLMPGK